MKIPMPADRIYELADNQDEYEHGKEIEEMGHDCGHQFTVKVTSLGHSGIFGQGPESHTDQKVPFSAKAEIVHVTTVRAHNLQSAMRRAARKPLNEWEMEDGDGAPYGE